ncbi:MAG: hypothetical protein DMG65_18120 [Candidatus Angelobacter sp. Gp1-AA117]|nr:MAG: hypothetical protein DMG65_18120 [Candidatus Angelobacter sp. Gp1-AA117]
MPVGVPLRKVPAGNVPKDEAINRLNEQKKNANGKRLQEISFLLAVLGNDYEKNRDYLLSLLNHCTTGRGICDEDPGAYLVNLYRRGHNELLPPLLDAGRTRHAALAELLGSFYSSVITQTPKAFIAAIQSRPQPEQKALCYMAGASDGSGMPPEDVNKVRKALRASTDKLAKDCLAQVEQANKKL